VDVRLAALDALGRHGNQPQVRAGLLDALQAQQSPLVQVAVIDLIVELRDTKAIEELRRCSKIPVSIPPCGSERNGRSGKLIEVETMRKHKNSV